MRKEPILLDIGCGLGNDIRKVVTDGFPAEGCVASGICPEFWDLGRALFKSTAHSFLVPFIARNVFDSAMLSYKPTHTSPLGDQAPDARRSLRSLSEQCTSNPFYGRVSAIHASLFFHLFDEASMNSNNRTWLMLLLHFFRHKRGGCFGLSRRFTRHRISLESVRISGVLSQPGKLEGVMEGRIGQGQCRSGRETHSQRSIWYSQARLRVVEGHCRMAIDGIKCNSPVTRIQCPFANVQKDQLRYRCQIRMRWYMQ